MRLEFIGKEKKSCWCCIARRYWSVWWQKLDGSCTDVIFTGLLLELCSMIERRRRGLVCINTIIVLLSTYSELLLHGICEMTSLLKTLNCLSPRATQTAWTSTLTSRCTTNNSSWSKRRSILALELCALIMPHLSRGDDRDLGNALSLAGQFSRLTSSVS